MPIATDALSTQINAMDRVALLTISTDSVNVPLHITTNDPAARGRQDGYSAFGDATTRQRLEIHAQ